MVRGGVTTCVVVMVALAASVPAFAQTPPSAELPPRFPLAIDELVAPGAPPVPSRTSLQPRRQPAGVPDEPDFTLPDGTVVPVPQGKAKEYRFTRRYGTPNYYESSVMPDGVRRVVFTGGVILSSSTDRGEVIEFATDDMVVWIRGLAIDNVQNGFQSSPDGKTEVELYLSGNVIIRTKTTGGPQTLRASAIYYDVPKERCIALAASLAFTPKKIQDPIRMHGEEIRRLDAENWEILHASVDGSKLPSDPGLRFDSSRALINDQQVRLRNVFGIPYRQLWTWEPVYGDQRTMTTYNTVPKLAGVPIFYSPYLRTDLNEPLGPFQGFSFGQNRIYGTQLYTNWNMFQLLALKPPPGQRWRLDADYLSLRGPGLGTEYMYMLPPDPETGLAPPVGDFRIYSMLHDTGQDILGGNRGVFPDHPLTRGQLTWRHQQELMEGLYFQGQLAYLSDQNFLEQYFKQEFDLGPNHETFAYLSWNSGNFWASGLVDPRFDRPWAPQTEFLPRFDGALMGQSLFDRLVYNSHGSVTYAQTRPAANNPYPVLSTDRLDNTGRIDFMQELNAPFNLGPVKLAPYGTLDLAGYTNDLNNDAVGRVWGGGGLRTSMPVSRLYEDVSSELFNLRGLYHKAVFGANYLYARTNVPYTDLPLVDRLNDDSTDQSWRNMTPFQPTYVSGPAGFLLANSGSPFSQFNPQQYLIRRGVTNRADTLDDINVLQMDLRQRLQTKRGYPGQEHTVDAFVLDTSISFYPDPSRDNFGHPWAFAEYDALWNVGDRVALVSSAWVEPYVNGSRYFTIGTYLNRTDRTNFYLGYRQTDPINSRAVTASVSYQLSKRYFLNGSSSYDFGINQAMANSLTLTRTGTDLTFMFGVNYNSITNNFGATFMVTPNLVAALSPGRFNNNPLLGQQNSGGR